MTEIAVEAPRRDARVIGLIGAAHCTSHFFQLVLPPLFPLMTVGFGVDLLAVALFMTIFFSTSALAQIAAGFIVDHIGAQRVLPAGITCLGLAMLGIGLVPSYWMALPLAALAGLGNSIFHPADYSVLTARVTPSRMARAYSVHTVSGTVGWAIAPVTMGTLSQWLGWRGALIAVGLFGLILAAFMASEHAELTIDRHGAKRAERKAGFDAKALLTTPILMAFLYFTLLAIAGGATQNFFPTMLPQVQGVTLHAATLITTFYLTASATGSFVGGYLADMTKNHDRIIGAGLIGAAALALAIGFVPMHAILVFAAAVAMGFLSGLTVPSRDMLVRAATPPGATGKIFGFVYSGLDLGSLIAPLVVAGLIDRGETPLAFVFIAAALAATVGAAVAVKHNRHVA